ncbi:unnamed protein product [Parnassius apollo]|uniref:(apollo) hypothetical protein n=1 Tax=Parnassius apollo TaxID=110799 RepID=A0A8S3XG18_PARAO|nr:unnamed protein product [Parnassius apollo]
MNNDDFLDWKGVCSQMGVNITKDEEGNTIKFADLKVVKVDKNHPRAIFFKTSYEQQEFKKAEVIRKKKSVDVEVKKAYDVKPALNKKKKDGLLELIRKNAIPRYYAPFYNSL